MTTLRKPFDLQYFPAVEGHEESGGYTFCGYYRYVIDTIYTNCRYLWPTDVYYDDGVLGTNVVYVCDIVEVYAWGYRCEYLPYVPAVEASPAHWEASPRIGWDAGAQSTESQEGDCELEFSLDRVTAVYIGLSPATDDSVSIERFHYAFYLYQANYVPTFVAVVDGAVATAPAPYTDATVFKIRRVGATVAFLVDDLRVHTEYNAYVGGLYAGTSVYASGDEVPEVAACCT